MLHSWCKGATLLVQGCCTFLAPFFHFVYWQTDIHSVCKGKKENRNAILTTYR